MCRTPAHISVNPRPRGKERRGSSSSLYSPTLQAGARTTLKCMKFTKHVLLAPCYLIIIFFLYLILNNTILQTHFVVPSTWFYANLQLKPNVLELEALLVTSDRSGPIHCMTHTVDYSIRGFVNVQFELFPFFQIHSQNTHKKQDIL